MKTVRQCSYKHLLIHFHHEIALGYKNTKSGLTYNQHKSYKIFNCDLSSWYRNLSPTRTIESMTNCYILYLAFMIFKCKVKPLEYGPHSPRQRPYKILRPLCGTLLLQRLPSNNSLPNSFQYQLGIFLEYDLWERQTILLKKELPSFLHSLPNFLMEYTNNIQVPH